MAERVIFLLRDHAATQQLMEVADTWDVQCKKLDDYADASLAKLAFTAGALVVQERSWRMALAAPRNWRQMLHYSWLSMCACALATS